MNSPTPSPAVEPSSVDERVAALLARMTLAEKIGQMNQVNADVPAAVEDLRAAERLAPEWEEPRRALRSLGLPVDAPRERGLSGPVRP